MMPAVFAVSSELYNRGAAIVATALVACAPPFIEYSVNARGYTSWYGLRAGSNGNKWRRSNGWGLCWRLPARCMSFQPP
jgi:hypothetical protein